MRATTSDKDWTLYLEPFTKHNLMRPTRLGVFSPDVGGVTDYWIECGLPLLGIAFHERNNEIQAVIDLEGLCHTIEKVAKVAIRMSTNGEDEGIDVTESNGTTTALRFEADG